MNSEKTDIELIERYLREELGDSEKALFEQRLEKDKELSGLLEEMRAVHFGIKKFALEEKLTFLNSVDGEMEQVIEKNTEGKGRQTRILKWVLWASAAILLLVLGFFGKMFLSENSISESERLFAENSEHYPSNVISRAENDGVSDAKNKAYEAYEFYNYEEAARLLEQVYITEKDSSSAFFAAISYLNSKNLEKAKQYFDISEQYSLIDRTELEWQKALLLLRKGEIETFRRLKAQFAK